MRPDAVKKLDTATVKKLTDLLVGNLAANNADPPAAAAREEERSAAFHPPAEGEPPVDAPAMPHAELLRRFAEIRPEDVPEHLRARYAELRVKLGKGQ